MAIAVFKFIEAAGLLALGFGVRHVLHADWEQELAHWIDLLRMDPHNRYLMWLMEKLANVSDHRLKELSVGTFFYAGLRLLEGTGLALRQRWAEYLTIVTTGALVPLEVYEIVLRLTWQRIVVLMVNLVVVGYLVWELRRSRS